MPGNRLSRPGLPSVALLIILLIVSAVALILTLQRTLGLIDMSGSPTSTSTPPPDCLLASFRNPISRPPEHDLAEITAPSQCRSDLPTAPNYFEARGTYSEEIEGKALWVLAYAPDGLYYLQGIDSCEPTGITTSFGNWRTKVVLGQPGSGQQFDIVLTMTEKDSDADRVFNDWLLNGCQTGNFPGFSETQLPSGLTELDAVTIQAAE